MLIYLVLLQIVIVTIHISFGLNVHLIHTCKYVSLLTTMKPISHEFIITKISTRVSYWPNLWHSFFYLHVCVCESIHMCTYKHTYVHVEAILLPVHWARNSQSSPDLTDMASLANRLARDQLSLCFWGRITARLLHPPAFMEGLGIWTLASALVTEPSPRIYAILSWKISFSL